MAMVVARQQMAPAGAPPPASAAAPATAAPAAAAPAGAAATEGPDLLWVGLAYVLVVGGAIAGWALWKAVDPKALAPAAGFSIFAPIYILAQGIERFIEPFSKYFGITDGKTKNDAEDARNTAFASMTNGTVEPDDAAKAQVLVNRIRRNSAVFAWGIASFLAMIACGSFGIFLLAACGFDIPAFWDIALTGLAVGSGTKPLHDLIGNLQKAKNEKTDPAEVATAD